MSFILNIFSYQEFLVLFHDSLSMQCCMIVKFGIHAMYGVNKQKYTYIYIYIPHTDNYTADFMRNSN